MIELIRKNVDKYSDKIAYSYLNDHITYQELWNKAIYYSKLLEKQGSEPVAIYGGKEVYMIVSILACLLARRAYVPIGVCTPLSRIQKIIDLSGASLVISQYDSISLNIEWCSLDELEKFQINDSKNISNDIAYIIFTSGSTGTPKGVPISYHNLNHFIEWISNLKPLCNYQNIQVLNQASFSFDLSVADLYYSLCNGHSLNAIDFDFQENFLEVFSVIKKVNFMVVTPTFMKLCLLDPDFCIQNFPNLNCIYFCGETLETSLVQEIWKRFPDCKIINAYGPTEATSAVCAVLVTREMLESNEKLPVGDLKDAAVKIDIVDDEIILKGESVFHGYLGGIVGGFYLEKNIPCYKTGDVGFIKNHFLYCNGRRDGQIKYKGYRIELNEIEHHIMNIEGIDNCAVVAKYDDHHNVKFISAFVTLKQNLEIIQIKQELSKVLPSYMIPKKIVIMEQLPVNQNGKIDRVGLSLL